MAGKHSLGSTPAVKHTRSFVMRMHPSALNQRPEIVCTAPSGFVFYNVYYVSVTDLIFRSCGNSTIEFPINKTFVLAPMFVSVFKLTNSAAINSHTTVIFAVYSKCLLTNNTFQDNSGVYGGSIYVDASSMILENNHFFNNSALSGGAIYVFLSTLLLTETNIYLSNVAITGGAITALAGKLILRGVSYLSNNIGDGTIYLFNSELTATGYVYFVNNTAYTKTGLGPGLSCVSSKIRLILSLMVFDSNGLGLNPVFFISTGSRVDILHGYTYFNNNSATVTSALMCETSTVTITGITIFTNNSAQLSSGAIAVFNCTLAFEGNVMFSSNMVKEDGQGAMTVFTSAVSFVGNTSFISNKGVIGTLLVSKGSVVFIGNSRFINNSVKMDGGTIFAQHSYITIMGHSTLPTIMLNTVVG